MLLRPPFFQQQDVRSQSSNQISNNEKQRSVRSTSKNRKKQTTIGISKRVSEDCQQNYKFQQLNQKQFDNKSTHSLNSNKSKKKSKQTTIAIRKKQQNYQSHQQKEQNNYEIFKLDSDQDNKSVNSYASKNSKKSKKKQSSLGKNKLGIKVNYYQMGTNNDKVNKLNSNNQDIQTYSKVQSVSIDEKNSQNFVKPMKHYEKSNQQEGNFLNKRKEIKEQKKTSYSPFQQITLNRQQDQQGPVFVLKQQEKQRKKTFEQIPNSNLFEKVNNNRNQNTYKSIQNQPNNFNNNQNQNKFMVHQELKQNLLDTKSLTKTRRNKIFQNQNNSKSNIDSCQLNLSSNFDKSRSKSKSKLGDLLKENRQKKINQSKTQNYSNVYSNSIIKKDLEFKPSQQHNQKNIKTMQMKPIQMKNIQQNEKFDLGLSQSDLNLSNSVKKENAAFHQKDSVHFNFQRQRQREHHKKGLSIISKDKKKQQLYSQIEGSLQSKKESYIQRLKKKQKCNEDYINSVLLTSQIKEQKGKEQILNPLQLKLKVQQKKKYQDIKGKQIQSDKRMQEIKNQNIRRNQENKTNFQIIKPNVQQKNVQFNYNQQNPYKQVFSIKQVARQQIKVKKSPNPVQNSNQIIQNEQRQKTKRQSQKNQNLKQKQKQIQIVLQRLNSTQTQEISQTKSQRSNSQQKRQQKKVKQNSINKGKKHAVHIRNQSPRAEESFYQSQKSQRKNNYNQQQINSRNYEQNQQKKIRTNQQQSKPKIQNKKRANLINFDSQEENQKVKSKTDSNFYQYCQQSQKSLKPPSSKPPLSKRSNASSSNSKSKPKQTTIKINKDTSIKINPNKKIQQKKKSLVQIAMQKNYEGSNYSRSNSQQSFYSRQSQNCSEGLSVDSKRSKSSKKSYKKQSTLPITVKSKNSTFSSGLGKPPIKKISSDSTEQIQVYDKKNTIYQKQKSDKYVKQENVRKVQIQNVNKRKIVLPDTYFINQRGNLVKRDLIIQGNRAYGLPKNQELEQQMLRSQMRRSRQRVRNRSKSRENSLSRLSKKQSQSSSYNQSEYQSSYSNATSSQNNNNVNSNSFYQRRGYKNQNQSERQNANSRTLQQFIKPLQQKPLYKFQKNTSSKIESEFYENNDKFYQQQSYVQKTTLNQLFGRRQNSQKQNRKKSLQRTQRNNTRKG